MKHTESFIPLYRLLYFRTNGTPELLSIYNNTGIALQNAEDPLGPASLASVRCEAVMFYTEHGSGSQVYFPKERKINGERRCLKTLEKIEG